MVVSAERLTCALMKLWLHIHRGLCCFLQLVRLPEVEAKNEERRGEESNPIQCEYMQKAMVYLH